MNSHIYIFYSLSHESETTEREARDEEWSSNSSYFSNSNSAIEKQ